jgi:hypothetical protein
MTITDNLLQYCEGVAFSPDGQTLASTSDTGTMLFDARTGALRTQLDYSDRSLAYSPRVHASNLA